MKRMISALLLAAMTLSLGLTASAISARDFEDYPDITHRRAVEECVNLGILNGFPDGTFRPFEWLTRGQVCKMIAIAMNDGETPRTSVKSTPTFNDIKGNWAEPYIEYCADRGIVSGVGGGRFKPNGQVTCLQVAKMLLVAILNQDAAPFTGKTWDVAVNSVADRAELFRELGYLMRLDIINREDTAQMFFNALQAASGSAVQWAPLSEQQALELALPLAIHQLEEDEFLAGAGEVLDQNDYAFLLAFPVMMVYEGDVVGGYNAVFWVDRHTGEVRFPEGIQDYWPGMFDVTRGIRAAG